ncbi:hypothetical protein V8F20_007974 [Naviculisporaceae sp. PSN 640]
MSVPCTIRRKLLLIGATGKQGRALIKALVSPHSASTPHSVTPLPTAVQQDPIITWDILAVTRNPSSPRAKSLFQLLPEFQDKARRHTLTLVQGDLDNPSSIRAIFDESTASDSAPIWGIFLVLQYPGLNKKQGTDGTKPDLTQHIELRQGKLIVSLAYEYGVEALVYSSSLPAPLEELSNDERVAGDGDKLAIEGYMKSLGEVGGKGGLNWIIIRPGFFMDNFEGFQGSITYTVFREGLTDDTTLPIVASKDIGHVVARIFSNHDRFLHKTLAIASELATVRDMTAAHQRATRKPIGGIPSSAAKLLIKMNSGVRGILKLYQLSHEARQKGTYYPEFEAECDLARTVCHLDNYEEWKRSEAAGSRGAVRTGAAHARISSWGWNNVSIWKLVTGRS